MGQIYQWKHELHIQIYINLSQYIVCNYIYNVFFKKKKKEWKLIKPIAIATTTSTP